MNQQEFCTGIESAIRKHFPKSAVNVTPVKSLGKDENAQLIFALGKDKSEWNNGIWQNDPAKHMITFRGSSELVKSELILGGILQGKRIFTH